MAMHKKNKEEAEKKRTAAAAVKAAAEAAAEAAGNESKPTVRQVPTDFSDLKDNIKFGEVAMAPPTITVKPRKAEMKDARSNLLLSSLVQNNKKGANKNKDNSIKKAQKLKKLSALQKSNLMNERQRVVDKYRKLKGGSLNKLTWFWLFSLFVDF